MSLLLAPYNDSMRLGQGFNSYTHELCIDKAVIVKDVAPAAAKIPSQVVSYSSRFVEKLSEVLDSMNISYSSSIKRGTVEVSGNTSTVDEDKFKSSDLNAIVSVKVVNQTTTIEDDCKFQPINGIMPGSPRFNEVYGDCYVSGFVEGGNFNGIVSMKILDRSNVDKITKSIKSGMNSSTNEFTLDSMSQSSSSDAFKNTETTISVSWMGGGQVKESAKLWDFDTMYAAAAAFPDKVAECPQRTWAILTKYKANRSFVEWSQAAKFFPLEYDSVASYTAELFDNYMEYKSLLKTLQTIISDKGSYEVQKDKHNAIDTKISTLVSVRTALRDEMEKIVFAVDLLSKDPGALKSQSLKSKRPVNALVSRIIRDAIGGRSSSSKPSSETPTSSGTATPDPPPTTTKPITAPAPQAPATTATVTTAKPTTSSDSSPTPLDTPARAPASSSNPSSTPEDPPAGGQASSSDTSSTPQDPPAGGSASSSDPSSTAEDPPAGGPASSSDPSSTAEDATAGGSTSSSDPAAPALTPASSTPTPTDEEPAPTSSGAVQSGISGTNGNFDFGSMIAPEVWADLFPLPKNPVSNSSSPAGVTDGEIRDILGFPPPPTSEPPSSTKPDIAPSPPSPTPAPLPPPAPTPPPAPDLPPPPIHTESQPPPVLAPPLVLVPTPRLTNPLMPLANTFMAGWAFNGEARLVYQDSHGNLREALSQPSWHTCAIPTTAKPKMNSPLSIINWADQARLYYISEAGTLKEKCWNHGSNWLHDEGAVFNGADIHPQSRLASFINPATMVLNVYFQERNFNIRTWKYQGGWKLLPNSLGQALPGSAMTACFAGPHIRLIFRVPGGKIGQIESSNDGHNFTSVPSIGPDRPPLADTSLTGGAWQGIPKAKPQEPIDQVRYFFRVDEHTIGLYAWNIKKPQPKSFEIFPCPDSSAEMGYCMWHDHAAVQQRLFVQTKQGQIQAYANGSEEHNWQSGALLPIE